MKSIPLRICTAKVGRMEVREANEIGGASKSQMVRGGGGGGGKSPLHHLK